MSDEFRTPGQNRALYLFFEWIAEVQNELGLTFQKEIAGLNIELIWTKDLVKYEFWYPIQLSLFGLNSTRKLKSEQITVIADIIIKFLGDKGIYLEFPNMESFLNSMESKGLLK